MADGLQISPTDRDLIIRTIIGEAGGGDIEGMSGVANVIANRLASGKYGKTGGDVVLAPNQFEPWTNRGAELLGYDPQGPEYQNAGAVLDGVIAGKIKDNTGGATHFYAPTLQAQLGRSAPAWANGQGKLIAGQLYYAPQGPVSRASGAPASKAIADVTQPKAKAPTWAEVEADNAAGAKAIDAATAAGKGALPDGSKPQSFDALKAFGVDDSGGATPAATPAAPAPVPAAGVAPKATAAPSFDALKAFGVDDGAADTPAKTTDAAKSANDLGANAAFTGGAVSGIPVLGPLLESGVDYVGSHIGSAISGKPVAQVLAEGQARRAATAAAHPVATVGGNLTGATMALGPLASTEAGAAALGLRGATMLGRMTAGGASGAALGAADSYARGGSPAYGAAFGLGGGAIGPLAGTAMGGIINRLTDTAQGMVPTGIPGISRSAANLANQVIEWSGGHGAVAARAGQLGPLATLADTDPSLTAIAGGLASKPGEAQGIIRNALAQRAAGSGDRIGDTLHDVVGPDPGSVNSLDAAYRGTRSLADAASYPVIHATSPPVDASPVYATIEQQMQHATGPQRAVLERFQRELDRTANVEPAVTGPNGEEITPEIRTWDSQTLHNIRQDLDNVIRYGDQSTGVQPGTLSRTQGAVGAMRSSLDDTLKTQVPGMREADARSALNATNQNAVTEGYNSVMGGNVPHPDDFAANRLAANPATNAAANAGMASRIYRAFGTGTQRDAVTLNKLLAGGEDGFSAQNLGTAFSSPGPNGPVNRASALLDTLQREQAFNNTTNSVINNSETARRTAANKLLDETQPGGMSVLNASTAGMIAQPVKSFLVDPLIRTIMENPTAPRNVELARILIAQGGARGQFLAQLQRLAGRNALVDRIGRPMAAALNAGVNRLSLAAGVSQ